MVIFLKNNVFTIPSDFNKNTIYNIIESNKSLNIPIVEVYGSLSDSVFNSGRRYDILPQVSSKDFIEYIKYCNKNKIEFNYTFNFTGLKTQEFTTTGRDKIIKEIDYLYEMGVRNFTVANPAVIDILNEYKKDISITVSIISGVDSLDKLNYYCQISKVKFIYIHERVYRNLELLKKLVEIAHKFNKKVGIIVNSVCLSECPFRSFHYEYCSYKKKELNDCINEYYCLKCKIEKFRDKRKILTLPWIRPEDLNIYIKIGIDKFKISGREIANKNANFLKMVNVYNTKNYVGNLMLLFKGFKTGFYSNNIVIDNNKNLDDYFNKVFSSELSCSKYGCDNCMKCKNALNSIKIKNKDLVLKEYNEIIKDYLSVIREEG